MNYSEIQIDLDPILPAKEVLVAYLAGIGYESFVDSDSGLNAFIQEDLYKEAELLDVLSSVSDFCTVQHKVIIHEKKNWNEEWENSFQPVEVGDEVRIRAPFHDSSEQFKVEIVIEPKMSFGTGHHETTKTILRAMGDYSFKNKTVLDMGAGTGVLAIYAEKLGAKECVAIDIEEWAYENSIENASVNGCKRIESRLGGKEQLKTDEKFDVVIANINRNILLEDMHAYVACMNNDSQLLLSGFYTVDEEILLEKASEFGLYKKGSYTENNWLVLSLAFEE